MWNCYICSVHIFKLYFSDFCILAAVVIPSISPESIISVYCAGVYWSGHFPYERILSANVILYLIINGSIQITRKISVFDRFFR